ncbi:hypothetical protein LX95_00487 [Mesonia algae]|uniref:Uncharacterized protein n=2 Tax=Mesonia algae TaxID=213248 RepID=A0A2W7IBS1_9FLAO|nr:hypothetical protein LX95_00487 [Mesonia algae]
MIMKKLLTVAVLFTAFSFTSLDANAKKLPDTNNNCAEFAWNAASDFCAEREGGCSDYQYWAMTDTAYRICTGL